MPPALQALLAQIAGWACAAALARTGWLPAGVWPFVGVQALAATIAAAMLRSARWWLPIHATFAPLLIVAGRLGIAPGWYLAAFALLLAVYWTSFRTQVPLYLSNGATVAAVAALLPAGRPCRLLDLGSGTGALLRPLGSRYPESRFEGIEAAPAPWLLSRLLAHGSGNVSFRRGDFFAEPWSRYDVIYAFLSPVPMARVWAKAELELAAGAIVISNSFPIPGRKPDGVVEVGDRRATRLYVYRVAGGRAAK
ncbi:methyltransferase type 12 [Aromatoleum toluvorans]|uniref:Methyltransferase type 12 n=1 Tax=Aromatoleum toluvorans TaxID=92002 RepID=A0ABX1PWV6_9RHOO|nr:class I SAM-dependent methyltransferase [Aromatoleum toluvorans]NMG43921.1 methyltransferase type 12 [Aromatoleum toluvorans]